MNNIKRLLELKEIILENIKTDIVFPEWKQKEVMKEFTDLYRICKYDLSILMAMGNKSAIMQQESANFEESFNFDDIIEFCQFNLLDKILKINQVPKCQYCLDTEERHCDDCHGDCRCFDPEG